MSRSCTSTDYKNHIIVYTVTYKSFPQASPKPPAQKITTYEPPEYRDDSPVTRPQDDSPLIRASRDLSLSRSSMDELRANRASTPNSRLRAGNFSCVLNLEHLFVYKFEFILYYKLMDYPIVRHTPFKFK